MLKNKELILKMSLEQRIKLILSSNFGESGFVDNYNFPVFSFSPNPVLKAEGTFATIFPSDASLASSWDEELISGVYNYVGNEAKANVPYACFCSTDNHLKENISEEQYLTGVLTAYKAQGLNASGAYFNLVSPSSDNQNNDTDYLVTGVATPDSITFNSVSDAEKFPSRYGYCGLLYGAASCKEEVAQYLFYGCTTIFLNGDFMEEAVSYLVTAVHGFEKAQAAYKAHNLPLVKFDALQRSGEIVDERLINEACDRAVSLLLRLKNANALSVAEARSSLDAARKPLFNELAHDKLALSAAQRSCVLLKNDKKILPLKRGLKVAVIGEYAKNEEYFTSSLTVNPTAVRLAFDVINDYEIDTVGYAYGYLKGQSGRSDLISTAAELCERADCALLYLCTERGERELPQGQAELIEELSRRNVKIIAVVSADGVIDTSFVESCAALLYTNRAGQGEANAVLDIITGEVNPSGKLIRTFPRVMKLDEESALAERTSEDNIRYEFGYGLSYTQFEYRNLKINDGGASFTVVNTGNFDGYAVAQLYIKREGTGSYAVKSLRGFKKVFVKKNDAVKVEIPFNENTFRTYSEEKGGYVIEGGEYTLYVGESIQDIRLSAEMKLAPHVYAQPVHTREDVTKGVVGFTKTKEDKIIRSEKKKLSFGLKLFLAILLTVYFDAVLALFAFTNLIADKDLILYIVLGALAVGGNLFAAIYISVISKKRKYQKYLHPNQVLSDMVGKVRNFKEVAKVTYEKPAPVLQEEFVPEEEQAEELPPEEEVKTITYGKTFGESEAEESVYVKRVSFNELCENFRAFAMTKGVAVEPSSVRALFAAFASSRLIILNCKNTQAKQAFLTAVGEYFGNAKITVAKDDWKKPDDLLWDEEEEMFVTSGFANAVNAACKLPSQNFAIIIDNVNGDNLNSYFGDFIAYALSPSEKRTLTLSDELSLALPDNVCYILSPADADFTAKTQPSLARAAFIVEPIVSLVQPSEERVEIKSVSKNDFEGLVSDARERCFVDEKQWKRIDALSEAIAANERFNIDNKDIIRLEKYSAVMLDCGGDEAETVISMFTAKIVPLLKLTAAYRAENGGAAVAGMVEKLFGEDDVSQIRRALIAVNDGGEPAPVAEEANEPAVPAEEDKADKPAVPAEETNEPAAPAEGAKADKPAVSVEEADEPAPSAEEANEPASSVEEADVPSSSVIPSEQSEPRNLPENDATTQN